MAISDVDIMFLKDQLRYDPDSGKMFWKEWGEFASVNRERAS